MTAESNSEPGRLAILKRAAVHRTLFYPLLAICFSSSLPPAMAQNPSPARDLVEKVMHNELEADAHDHTRWIYRDEKKTPSESKATIVVETAMGDLSRTIEINGRPLTPQERHQDDETIMALVNSPARQQKERRDSQNDDRSTRAMMQALPTAFLWYVVSRSGDTVTLNFRPNPNYQAPSKELRVLGAMAGQMTIDARQQRLKMLDGKLTEPVAFGWGVLGKLQKGGTFHIERQQVAPREWQMSAIHVHIQGKALFFKSISEQQDEVMSGYKPAPQLTLGQAAEILRRGNLDSQTHAGR